MEDSEPDPAHEHTWGLVFPFVICQSNGGPYEDHAFVAGTRFGEAYYRLQAEKPDRLEQYVFPADVPQYELLAMDQGYTMTVEPWDRFPDEWALVTLTKQQQEAT